MRALGRPTSTSMSSLAERREHEVEVVEVDGDVLGLRLAELGRQPGADVDDAGHLGGDGVCLEARVGVGRHHEPVARDEQGGDDAGRLPVRRELGGEDVGLVGHDASKAVSSWVRTAAANACAAAASAEGPDEAVPAAGQLAEEDARAGDGGAVVVGQGSVQRQLDERVAAHEQPAGLTPREPYLDLDGHALRHLLAGDVDLHSRRLARRMGSGKTRAVAVRAPSSGEAAQLAVPKAHRLLCRRQRDDRAGHLRRRRPPGGPRRGRRRGGPRCAAPWGRKRRRWPASAGARR